MRAIRIRQRGTDLYITTMSANDLINNSAVDIWSPTHRDGYQRQLKPASISKLREYLSKGGILPTSLLVSVRGNINLNQTIQRISDNIEIVEITPRGSMFIVDGQRRGSALEQLLSNSVFQDFQQAHQLCLVGILSRYRSDILE